LQEVHRPWSMDFFGNQNSAFYFFSIPVNFPKLRQNYAGTNHQINRKLVQRSFK